MASFSRAYSNMTMSRCLIFLPKTAWDPRDMVAYFWTAPTAWFQGGTGPNSEDSPCPSVTSYWYSVEGFYPTVFEHQTTLGKPLSRPSASNHSFLSNSSWGARQNRWCPNSVTNLVNFLRYGFEKTSSKFGSTTPLGASAYNHDLECLMMFLQNFSIVATSWAELWGWTL